MLNNRKFSVFLRNDFWAKAAKATTLFENDLITPNRDLSPFQCFLGEWKAKHPVFGSKIC